MRIMITGGIQRIYLPCVDLSATCKHMRQAGLEFQSPFHRDHRYVPGSINKRHLRRSLVRKRYFCW